MTTITFCLALICGWIILAGFGELWIRIFRIWGSTHLPIAPNSDGENREGEEGTSPIGICLLRSLSALPIFIFLWGLEHSLGLGKNLVWLLPLLVGASLWLYYQNWKETTPQGKKTRIILEGAFLLGMLLTTFYLSQNPDINMSSERSADLCHTIALSSGETLPATDPWLPPTKADAYYTGQYYAGGWISRLCLLGPGPTYLASFILCGAWTTMILAAGAWILSRGKTLATILTVLTIVLGSNLCPLFIKLTHKDYYLSESMRYLGAGLAPGSPSHSDFGKKAALFLDAMSGLDRPEAKQNDLPVEALSYVFQLGDWHPQMGGFLVLGLLIVSIAACANSIRPKERILGAVCAAIAVPSLLLTNTWVAPLGALTATCWLVPLWVSRKKDALPEIGWSILAGFLTLVCLIAPLISLGKAMDGGFASKIQTIASAPEASFTPWPGWILIMGNALLWAILALVGNRRRDKTDTLEWRNSRLAAITSFLLLVICETLFVNDVYGGHFERFNTALKWYPATLLISTLLCAPLALTSKKWKIKLSGALLAVILIVPHTHNIFTKQVKSDPKTRYDFSGAGWIKKTPAKGIYETLRQMPKGIVLEYENDKADGFTSKSLAILTGQKNWLGWAWHLKLWKGPEFKLIENRRNQAISFYKAELEEAGKWAKDNQIDYITWSICLQETYEPGKFTPINDIEWEERWLKNNEMLKENYEWIETKFSPKREGIWVKRQKS